jgi:hypothetical protein
MKKSYPTKFSSSLSESNLSQGHPPKLPSTTPSTGTNGRNNPYSTLLEPQLDKNMKSRQLNQTTPLPPTQHTPGHVSGPSNSSPSPHPSTTMNAIYKMISKLPFEVREHVTSIVNMALFTSENSQKQYDGLKLEHLTLRNQHKKKMLECDSLNQRCEIFREQILKLEEKLGALQDDAESRQTYAIRNSKAISRLSSTNKTLIDAFALLTDGHPNSNLQNPPRKKATMVHRNSQRRKNNLLLSGELTTPNSRATSPDDTLNRTSSQPNSPAYSLMNSKNINLTTHNTSSPTNNHHPHHHPAHHSNSNQEVSVTKNEKLRERLLRVAKDHNRVVKNVENLESKIQGLRSSLRYAERRNRQLQLELDEIRENQSTENSSLQKHLIDGGGDSNNITDHRRGNSGTNNSKGGHGMKDRMDTRLSVLVNRNAFDPMDGIKYMDSMIAHLSATPCNLIEEDIIKHLCSRNACNLFDTEKIIIYILQPGGKYMNRYMTNTSANRSIDRIKLGEKESIAENILHHGLIRRYNNLKQTKNLFYNPEIDSGGDLTIKRILSVPIRELGHGRVIGVCQLLNKRENNKFSEVDELYLTAYGEMCGGLVAGSILFRRVWNESSIISGIIQSSYQLLQAVPHKETLCSTHTSFHLIDLLYHLEHVIRDALKCSKVKAFLISSEAIMTRRGRGRGGGGGGGGGENEGGEEEGRERRGSKQPSSRVSSRLPGGQNLITSQSHTPIQVMSLEQEAITMMTLKSSQLSLKTSLSHSGVAGHVITTQQPYLVEQASFDPWLNPEVDLETTPGQAFYCVPLINFENEIIGCIQLAPSPTSPNISHIQEKIEPLSLSFEKAADWLGYSLSAQIWNILQYIGKPSARPDLILSPITLTEKLATMPLSVQVTEPEAIRKRRQTIVKSVTMAEESSHLPGGGLYEQHHSIHKSSTKDEDLKDFLLQFPDYEQYQQQQQGKAERERERDGLTSGGNGNGNISKTNRSNPNTSTSNGVDILDTSFNQLMTSQGGNRISPSAVTSVATFAPAPAPAAPVSATSAGVTSIAPLSPPTEKEIENLKMKYEKEMSSLKSELFFSKEKSKTEILKLQKQIYDFEIFEIERKKVEKEEKEEEENLLIEYQKQYENDIKQLRQDHEREKEMMEKKMKILEDMIQSLQMKVIYVDQPIDRKHLDIVGTLNVSQIQIIGLDSIMNGKTCSPLLSSSIPHSSPLLSLTHLLFYPSLLSSSISL